MVDRRKVLSQAGFSLADSYDIEGSIAGVDHVDTHEVHLTHDMGPTMFSERLHFFILQGQTGNMLQNVSFDMDAGGDFPNSINRILGVYCLADAIARINHVTISIQDNVVGREMPIWNWDAANDVETQVRWRDDGAAAATFFGLRQTAVSQLPSLTGLIGSDRTMTRIFARGATLGFGAGNVELFVMVHVARPSPGEPLPAGAPKSFGLPIPGW